jgi:hypothetical protein
LDDAPWLDAIVRAAPHLFSLLDRDPRSRTYGLFDRRHWAWAFSDIAAPRAQEAVLPLALLHHADGSPHRGRPELLAWVGAGIAAWSRLAHADGSFDEAYPGERSWGATAFTACAIAETLALADGIDPKSRAIGERALGRAADFLTAHDETHGTLSNHLAAGAAALALAADRLGEARFGAAADALVDRIAREASAEGGLREYGGVDPGYQSHALGYLALYARRRPGRIDALLARAVELLAWVVGPDGALAPEIGSRDTAFFFPAGVEALGDSLPLAATLAARVRDATRSATLPTIDAMDEPNWIPMLTSYARAHRDRTRVAATVALPCDGTGERWMRDAGLYVRNTSRYHAIVATTKGGVIAAIGRDGRTFHDAGWATGRATSQWLGARVEPIDAAGSIAVTTSFRARRDAVPGVIDHLALRAASATIGRTARGAHAIKRLLVHRLIDREVRLPITLDRTIRCTETDITVDDRVVARGARPEDLAPVERTTSRHMGSARYFHARELAERAPVVEHARHDEGEVIVRRTRVSFLR